MSSFNQIIKNMKDVDFLEGVSLERFSTFKLKAIADVAIVKSIDALRSIMRLLREEKKDYRLLGWGANQILHDRPDWVYIKLDFEFDKEKLNANVKEFKLPASVSLGTLTAAAIKNGYSGWEVFTGIPASLGGAIFMNAGTRLGEIGELITEVEIMNTLGEIRSVKVVKDSFRYRSNSIVGPGEVIVGATIKHLGRDKEISKKIKDYLQLRRNTQPITQKTCGCVFKNSNKISAGLAIDALGLSGFQIGGLRVSTKHANFVENCDSGSYDDFLELETCLKQYLSTFYGIEFELEVKL